MTNTQHSQFTQDQEIELKLALPANAVKKFCNDPLLSELKQNTSELFNIYYDTPELDLWQAKIAVRLRRRDWQWYITVKTEASSTGGFSIRNEWESLIKHASPLAPDSLADCDFSFIPVPDIRRFLEKSRSKMRSVFSNHFTRTTWQYIDRSGQQMEIALDQGKIHTSAHKESISEVEIELLQGSSEALFKLAEELQQRQPLHPLQSSKSERGYALLTEAQNRPSCDWSFTPDYERPALQGFVAAALATLKHLQQNEKEIQNANNDPRFIQQACLALRRLYELLDCFSTQLPAKFIKEYRDRWYRLAAALNKTRAWNTYMHVYLAELLNHFPKTRAHFILTPYIEERCNQALSLAADAMKTSDYAKMILSFRAEIWRLSSSNAIKNGPLLSAFAQQQLQQALEKLHESAKDFDNTEPDSWQQLLESSQTLCYRMDFFTKTVPARRRTECVRILNELQAMLEKLNDMENFPFLFNDLPQKIYNFSYISRWQNECSAQIVEALTPLINNCRKMKIS